MDTETSGLAQAGFLVMSWYLGTIEGKQVIKQGIELREKAPVRS